MVQGQSYYDAKRSNHCHPCVASEANRLFLSILIDVLILISNQIFQHLGNLLLLIKLLFLVVRGIQLLQQIIQRGHLGLVDIVLIRLRHVRKQSAGIQILDEVHLSLLEPIKLRRLRYGPIAERDERHSDASTVNELPLLGRFERNERLERFHEAQRLIEQVGEDPALVSQDPHAEEDGAADGDEEEDEDEQSDRHVPDEYLEEVGPDREARAKEEADDEEGRHHVAEGLVTLVDPGKVTGLIKFSVSGNLLLFGWAGLD